MLVKLKKEWMEKRKIVKIRKIGNSKNSKVDEKANLVLGRA